MDISKQKELTKLLSSLSVEEAVTAVCAVMASMAQQAALQERDRAARIVEREVAIMAGIFGRVYNDEAWKLMHREMSPEIQHQWNVAAQDIPGNLAAKIRSGL